MGSIDAAVDAGSSRRRRRVGTDMVRNAGKGEKEEERVWRRRMAFPVSSPNWIE